MAYKANFIFIFVGSNFILQVTIAFPADGLILLTFETINIGFCYILLYKHHGYSYNQ